VKNTENDSASYKYMVIAIKNVIYSQSNVNLLCIITENNEEYYE